MLIVYTHKITPRVSYIFKHFFVRLLQSEVKLTSSVEEFVAFNGPKMSYTTRSLGNEFHVQSNDLLFEQGVNDMEIKMNNWDDTPCFFYNSVKASIPFDIFAASFYLISRYEEYLPYVQDQYERFSVVDSLAYKEKFLEEPLVDIWALKFLKLFTEKFPEFNFKQRMFEFTATFDVDNVFAYQQKGFIRNFGGFFRDLFRFQFQNMADRVMVLLRFKDDPYNTYNYILNLTKKYNIKTIFFFLIGDYTTYDTNVSSSNSTYKSLIKSIADYVNIGLHPSYFTMKNEQKLKKEKQKLEQIINQPILRSRQHFLRVKLPETYQNLIDLDVIEDYSMGYAKHFGFRASTCTPFYFYDLDFEIQTPLKIFPFSIMDVTLRDHLDLVPNVAKSKILSSIEEVKKVNGQFVLLFHNETLSEFGRWSGWRKIYEDVIASIYD